MSSSFPRSARLLAVSAASVVVAGLGIAPAGALVAAASNASVSYARIAPAPKIPARARLVGSASSRQRVSGAVGLAPRNAAALAAAATAASTPRSAGYRHYIDKGEFAAKYAPAAATVTAVKAALAKSHLTVTSVSDNGLLVNFAGSVGNAESAFRTHINSYRLASGRIGTATTGVSFPSSIASQVVSVVGLDTLVTPHSDFVHSNKPATVKAVAGHIAHYAGGPAACESASMAAKEFGGLTDDQLAHAYGVDGLYKSGDLGAGQTVALYELEPFSAKDAAAFDSCYFTPTAAKAMASRLTVHPVDGGAGGGAGSGEAILDVEDVSAFAPNANIEVYEAPQNNGAALDEYSQIVSDDSASVVSSSWGECEQDVEATEPGTLAVENTIFEQAALQGQTVMNASGDTGNNACEISPPATPQLTVSDPASQPFVTAVGGTSTVDATNPPTQLAWNGGILIGAGGGGVSSVWGAPSWQQPFLNTAGAEQGVTDGATACPQSSNGSLCREVPDVSAQGDDTTGAITVYITAYGGWITIGGTSSSTPIWAAILADINKSASCASSGNIGFASPSLYAVAATPAGYAASYNDLKTGSGNNDILDAFDGKDYATRTGYDMATGLGTPKVTGSGGRAGLAAYLCGLGSTAATTRPVISTLSRTDVGTHPNGTLTITGTGFTGAKAVSIGAYALPAGTWSVTSATTIVVTAIPTAAEAGNGGLGPQDGTGRAPVYVTAANGNTSVPSPTTMLIYLDGSGSALPSVAGVLSYGGPQSGGNTVTVFGSGFNYPPVTVTVGGVAATNVTVLAPNRLTMTVPAYASGTTGCATGDDAVNDACQAQVVVHNANGTSATASIQPSYTGAPYDGPTGGVPAPACATAATCEVAPAASEYDYFPTPTITSVTTTAAGDPVVWASEDIENPTIAVIKGSGFDWQGLYGPYVGTREDIAGIVSVTPTEIDAYLLPRGHTPAPVIAALTVKSMAGTSNSQPISYAGVPKLTSLSPNAGPEAGGTTIHLKGSGFEGVSAEDGGLLGYSGLTSLSVLIQLSGYTATSSTSITATTPQGTPGVTVAEVCTITDCSRYSFRHYQPVSFDYFAPGNPVVTSVSSTKGAAAGGQSVVIHGRNLGGVVAVKFGNKAAIPPKENIFEELFESQDSTTRVTAIVPASKPGLRVPIQVVTTESLDAAGGKPSAITSAAHYRYVASAPAAPQHVRVTRHGTKLRVHWKPPAANGGHPVTGYKVSAVAESLRDVQGGGSSSGGGGVIVILSSQHKPKTPPAVSVTVHGRGAHAAWLKGLRAGWYYLVRVQAINKLGKGRAGYANPVLVRQSA